MNNSITFPIYITAANDGRFMVYNKDAVVGKVLKTPTGFAPQYDITMPMAQAAAMKTVQIPEKAVSADEVAQLLQTFQDAGCSVCPVNL